MSIVMFRSKIKAEHVPALEAAVKKGFAALEKRQPAGIRYASFRLADGVTYVAMLALDEGVENPLPAIPEFQEFQEGLKTWLAEQPAPDQLTVVGSYRLF